MMTHPAPTDYRLWSQLIGYYAPSPHSLAHWAVWDDFGGGLDIYVAEDRLWLRAPFGPYHTPQPLRPAADLSDTFYMGEMGPRLRFWRDDAGYIRGVRLGVRAFYLRPRWHAPHLQARLLLALGVGLWMLGRVVRR